MSELALFDFPQVLPPLGFRFPARMTALSLGGGEVALVSPIPLTDGIEERIAALGEVKYLVAPNLLHHLYLAPAIERYPGALVLAPAGLRQKRPDLRTDGTLEAPLPERLGAAVDVVHLAGAPAVDEFAFFHRATETLVVTDLVFHVRRPEGAVANVVLWAVGCHGKLASSRAWKLAFVKDRRAMGEAAERLLALPFRTLVMAHGDVVREDARAELARALSWILPARRELAPSY
ncbi:MAG TPA: DUF4336 domain-containing protein [Polyangiaceae bacterium]|nr:DUF4336 domain-containing protein [Polyangiaceae bacterium]